MGVDWRSYDEPALPELVQSAADCFVDSGYHGASVRELAARAGLSVPGWYHHFASKQAVLVEIMTHAMAELRERSAAADADAGDDPLDRLDAHIACLVLFHAHRGDLAFLAASEIRGLDPDARETHIAARDRQQALLQDIVDDGIRAGVLDAPHPHGAVRAVVTMCVGVSQWYRLDGPTAPAALAEEYVALARRMLGASAR